MDLLLSGLQFEICQAFLDDVIVYGRTFEQTCERLQLVLDRIGAANLKLKAKKCRLFVSSVKYLGYIVSREGIAPDPDKIQAVVSWPVPKSLSEVRSFTAMCSYNRNHIRGFAEIARPLYDLMKKGRQFEWRDSQPGAFDQLKKCLVSAPILASPIDEGVYTLDTDASSHSLGAVLNQTENGIMKVISYASRILQPSERSYCSVRLELLGLIFGLKKYRHFLLGRKFVIRTDNAALTSLMKTPEPLAQQGRWLDLISEYDFQIVHRPGVQNRVPDALSRIPCNRDDVSKMCPLCRAKNKLVELDPEITKEVVDSPKVEDVVQRCAVVGQSTAGEGGLQAGHDGPQSPPTPASAMQTSSGTQANECNDSLGISIDRLRSEQLNDRVTSRVMELLTNSGTTADWSAVNEDVLEVQALFAQRQTLQIRDGILYRQFQTAEGKINHYQGVIPRCLRIGVMSSIHGSLLTGHFGLMKTEKRLCTIAYWPGWKSDVKLFLNCCEKCNQFKKNVNARHGYMKHAGCTAPWQKVHIDLMGPFTRSHDQYSYILTAVCSFSKYIIAIALKDKSAIAVARALMRQVFLIYSPVELLVHDNGGEFCNSLQVALNGLLEIQTCRVTRYRPAGNGVVERSHATLNKLFATTVAENQRNWTDCLPFVVYAYNTAYHSSTTFSPFYLMFLREPRMGIEMFVEEDAAASHSSPDAYVQMIRERMQAAYRLVHEQLKVNFERAKRRYDIRVRACQFKVGDLVWYFSPRKRRDRSPKWQLFTNGPYQIVRRLNDVNYVIRRTERQSPFTVHVDRLRPYMPPVVDSREVPVVRQTGGGSNMDVGANSNNLRPPRDRRPPRRLIES